MAHAHATSRHPTIPDLWAHVRSFLASIFVEQGSPRAQLHTRLDAKQRSAVLRWLKPAERMARQLILVAAITHLMMTPHGQRLRASAKPITPPGPPRKPVPVVHTGINLGATIASHQAALALHEQRAQLAAVQTDTAANTFIDPDDPATWRTNFRILHWIRTAQTQSPPQRAANPAAPDPRRLIRRMEALRRVLEDPTARIQRLTAYLARLPRGALGLPPPHVRHRGRPNPILSEAIFALHALTDTAVEIFNTS